ncbi:MAG: hypothetical protein K2L55_08320 [Muribaculaceae bacterium]|nr:hypothetical protein [Muribaculaceae bacterium]
MAIDINSLIVTSVLLIILAIVYCFSYRWGVSRGYKVGHEAGMRYASNLSELEYHLRQQQAELKKIQCIHDCPILDDMQPHERVQYATSAVYDLCQQLAESLIENDIVRPVVIDDDIRPYRNRKRIMVSLYVSPDPVTETYPKVVFFRRHKRD